MSGKYEFKEIDIKGKSVKIEGSELLQFFYPNYQVIEGNVMIIDSPTIYKGKTEHLNRIRSFEHDVISVTALGEFDLKDCGTLVNLTYSKWRKEPPKTLVKYIDKLEYEEVLKAVKIHWITGKWTIRKYNRSGAFIKLLECFGKGTNVVIENYFTLIDDKYSSSAYMEKSMLSFLTKVVSTSNSSSDWYNRIIKQYRKSKKHLLQQAIDKYIDVNIENKDLKIYNLIYDLNVVDKKLK